ncbi:MAG: prepilin peptidase [Leptospirales bacterium]
MPTALALGLALLGGGVWGSFLGVLAVRIPGKTSIIHPGSRCDHCGTRLSPRDLVPFLSWILLRGRCRTCHGRILPEVLLSEILTALFMGATVLFAPSVLRGLLAAILFSFALPLTMIDIRHQRLPHRLTLPCLAAGILASGISRGPHGLIGALLGALLGFLPLALVAIFYPRGLGMGDAIWLAAIGAYTGPEALSLVLFVASSTGIFATLLVYLYGLYKRSRTGSSLFSLEMPFGPFLSLGALTALLAPGFSRLINQILLEILP